MDRTNHGPFLFNFRKEDIKLFEYEYVLFGDQEANENLIAKLMEFSLEVRSLDEHTDKEGVRYIKYSFHGSKKNMRKYYRWKFRENKTWVNFKLILSTCAR